MAPVFLNIANNGFTYMKTYGNIAILCCFSVCTLCFLVVDFFPLRVRSCHFFIFLNLFSMSFSLYDTNYLCFMNMWKQFLHVLLLWRYHQWKSVKFIILNHPVYRLFKNWTLHWNQLYVPERVRHLYIKLQVNLSALCLPVFCNPHTY